MRDPLAWSIPLGRLFGIQIRVHWTFPVVFLGLILRYALKKQDNGNPAYEAGTWIDASMLLGLLFVSVLLHEFGHCFGGRWVNGEASEILIWPLGGLAYVDVPQTPKANFITVAAGPAVNLVLCLACGLLLGLTLDQPYQPPWNPLHWPSRINAGGAISLGRWGGEAAEVTSMAAIVLARLFWVNWFLLLLNLILIGFPLDGGRLLQCILWPYVGYRQATLAVVFTGFAVMFVVGLFAIVTEDLLALCLAVFIYYSCKYQWIVLETGGEESLFGYDFSQGYTSLERDQPTAAPARKQSGWFQRWLQRRAARKLQKEQEDREADERRMDELLEKVQREGLAALTDEERRFMKRVSDRYRHR
jgi:stage IV sporulation protein FB